MVSDIVFLLKYLWLYNKNISVHKHMTIWLLLTPVLFELFRWFDIFSSNVGSKPTFAKKLILKPIHNTAIQIMRNINLCLWTGFFFMIQYVIPIPIDISADEWKKNAFIVQNMYFVF